MGLTQTDGGIHVSVVAAAKACSLLLFEKQEGKNGKEARFREIRNLPFPEKAKTGHVWSMTVNGTFDTLYYAFEADGKRFSDPYGPFLCRAGALGKVKSGEAAFTVAGHGAGV